MILIKVGINSNYVFAVKDGVIYCVFCLFIKLFIRDKQGPLNLLILVVFGFFLILNSFIIKPDYNAKLNNIRQLISPLVLLFIFLSIKVNNTAFDVAWHWTKAGLGVCFTFGVFELVFSIWELVRLDVYFNLKGIPVNSAGLSFMFYEPMLNYSKRMTSTFIDPISAGHFFASFLILIYAFIRLKEETGKTAYVFIILAFLGILLCFSKGAMLQLYIGIIIFEPKIFKFFKCLLLLVPVWVVSVIPENLSRGLLIHLEGTSNAFSSATFFGYGIGSSGNYAKMFSNDLALYYKLGISDSYVGSLIGQIGFVGLSFWFAIAVYLILCYSKSAMNFKIAFSIFISIFLVSVMSENTLNVTSFLLPALMISIGCRKRLGFS